jgi:uncharacterized protein (TIGR02996 family)
MTDATGAMLLRAIVEEPESDDLRLIYADWLQDHGDPARAEFIRLQVRLATLDEDDPARPDLEDREEDLLAAHRERWLAGLPRDRCSVNANQPTFRRGFIDELEIDCVAFVSEGETLLRTTPVERVVLRRFSWLPPAILNIAALARCHALGRVRFLAWRYQPLDSGDLATLLASPYLRGLRGLELNGAGLGTAGAECVAAWPGATHLEELILASDAPGPEGIAALAGAPLGQLRRLFLPGCGLGAEGVQALVQPDTSWSLRELGLSGNRLGSEGLGLLGRWRGLASVESLDLSRNFLQWDEPVRLGDFAASSFCARLRSLDLSDCRLEADGGRQLAGMAVLSGLRRLNLTRTSLEPAGVGFLATAPRLGALRHLDLAEAGVEDEGIRYLARSRFLRPIELDMRANGVTAGAFAQLAASPFLDGVDRLLLDYNLLGDAGLAALAARPHAFLSYLSLERTGIGTEGFRALLGAPWAGRLRSLELSGNLLDDEAGVALADSPVLAGLRSLDLSRNRLGDATAQALARASAARNLRHLNLGGNAITDDGAMALAASPYLAGLATLNLWETSISGVGFKALWTNFGNRVGPQAPAGRHAGDRP